MRTFPTKQNDLLLAKVEFEKVFETYYATLAYFACRLIKDRLNAEDIVSNIFITLWEKRSDFENEYGMKSFLYISVRNACLNSIKTNKTLIANQHAYSQLLSHEEDFVLNAITRAEVLQELYALIKTLPEECGKIMMLRLDGMDNKGIAKHQGLSIHTVKNQLSRGLSLLKGKLKNRKDLLAIAIAAFCDHMNH